MLPFICAWRLLLLLLQPECILHVWLLLQACGITAVVKTIQKHCPTWFLGILAPQLL
jgi:hypothetical protein